MGPQFSTYIDFDFRNEPDATFLMAKTISGVHAAIVQECGPEEANRQALIAISFPDSGKEQGSGDVLRVFAKEEAVLGRLMRHSAVHRFIADLSLAAESTTKLENISEQDHRRSRIVHIHSLSF